MQKICVLLFLSVWLMSSAHAGRFTTSHAYDPDGPVTMSQLDKHPDAATCLTAVKKKIQIEKSPAKIYTKYRDLLNTSFEAGSYGDATQNFKISFHSLYSASGEKSQSSDVELSCVFSTENKVLSVDVNFQPQN